MKTLLVAAMKGGVTKSTTVQSLAAIWALEHGKRVAIRDGDPQGTIGRQFGHGPVLEPWREPPVRPRFHPEGRAEAERAERIAERTLLFRGGRNLGLTATPNVVRFMQRDDWDPFPAPDLCLIDSPPQLMRHILAAADVADLVLIPVDNSTFGLEGLEETLDLLAEIRPPVPTRVLVTRVRPRERLNEKILEFLDRRHYGMRLDVLVPEDARVRASQAARIPLAAFAPTSRVNEAYREVAGRLLRVMDGLIRVPHSVPRGPALGAGAAA